MAKSLSAKTSHTQTDIFVKIVSFEFSKYSSLVNPFFHGSSICRAIEVMIKPVCIGVGFEELCGIFTALIPEWVREIDVISFADKMTDIHTFDKKIF